MDSSKKQHHTSAGQDDGQLESKVQALTELAARAQAELQNAKIRMEKDAADIRTFASERLIRKLLPTIDNFQRAFGHLPEDLKDHEWVKGIAAIEQELMKRMAEEGLVKIDALGAPFDPHVHDVLMEGPGEKGVVIDVLDDGYLLHGKVLRPAKVKLGNGASA
jgi:molecular chaperone GrpE